MSRPIIEGVRIQCLVCSEPLDNAGPIHGDPQRRELVCPLCGKRETVRVTTLVQVPS